MSSETVGDLKEAIFQKKPVAFATNVDADDLELWKGSVIFQSCLPHTKFPSE